MPKNNPEAYSNPGVLDALTTGPSLLDMLSQGEFSNAGSEIDRRQSVAMQALHRMFQPAPQGGGRKRQIDQALASAEPGNPSLAGGLSTGSFLDNNFIEDIPVANTGGKKLAREHLRAQQGLLNRIRLGN